MKVALISPNPAHLREMAAVLVNLSHQVTTHEGGRNRMRAVAEQQPADLMLVDGMCCDAGDLEPVEYVCTHFPHMAVVLLCPTHTPEFLIQAMRAGVREVLPSPAHAPVLTALVHRIESKRERAARGKPGAQVLAFMPCKGGSGATFLCTNLGWQLSQSASVLLIDLNLQFGDAAAALHDGRPVSTLADLAGDIERLDPSLLSASTLAIGPRYGLLAAPEEPSQSLAIRPEHVEAILTVARTNYDFVLLDMPRAIDPVSIRALDRADRVFAVMQQSVPAMRNARQLLSAFHSLGYPPDKTELVVNRYEKSNAVHLDDLRRTFPGMAVRTVPNAFREVSAAIDHGEPLTTRARSSPVARTLAEFAESLCPQAAPSRSLFDRLLKRA